MKTKEITGTGVVGLNVTLNVMDRFSIFTLLSRWEEFKNAKKARDDWYTLRDSSAYWNMTKEEKDAWNREHPAPEYTTPDFYEEMKPVEIFLKKLACTPDEQSDVFNEISE